MKLKDLIKPTYLGDSVYCGRDPNTNNIVIGTCNEGNKLENVIYLEDEVIDFVISYYKKEVSPL